MINTISSINYDEQQIIRDILLLHGNGNYIDCDPTYSKGNFYKKGLPIPRYIFDKYPQSDNVLQAESNNLPLANETCNIIMFDPPFVMSRQGYNGEKCSGIISNRFTSFRSWKDLKIMYSSSLKEFFRILKPNGIVIFKCQDAVDAGNIFTHCWVMQQAVELGFYPKDLFILLSKHRIVDKSKQQRHARKYHSYFWVFQKKKTKIDYSC
jgi:hypothetical protein